MKFYFRRALFALISMPFVFLAYGVLYFGLGLIAETNSVSVVAYLDNLLVIGILFFVVVLFLPQLLRLVDRVVA